MSIPGRVSAAVRELVLGAGLGITVLVTLFAGIGFLVAGFFLWIEQYKSIPVAAAITGGALLALAILIAAIGRAILKKMKKPQPSLLAEFGGIAGTVGRLAGFLIRRDPRKAMILAVIAGAVADYITSGDKKKS